MAGKNDAEFGKFSNRQLDQIAKHAAKGIMAELNGDKAAADVHYRRAKVVTDTAQISNRK